MTDAATSTSTEAEQATRGDTASAGAAAPTTIERPGSLPTKAQQTAAGKDKTLTSPAAVEMAHDALSEITDPLSVGAHTGARSEAERLVTHLFECNLAGYRGWRWAVTMTRPPRSRTATICEMELLPGEDALLAPAWVPWADRLQPGDVGRGDRLPKRETDERLEPGWEAAGEHEGDRTGEDGLLAVGTDAIDFGRARVLSPEGVQRAADRWYDGDHGPEADGVRKAHATCATCGFFIPMSGPLRNVFGVCANEWAADDGRVVSLDHGCGAHSETDLPDQGPDWPVIPSRLDEAAMEPIGTDGSSIREGQSLEEAQAAERAAAEEAAPSDKAGSTTTSSKRERTDDAGDEQADESAEAGSGSAEDGAAPSRSRSRSAGTGRRGRRRATSATTSEESTTDTADAVDAGSGDVNGTGDADGTAAPEAAAVESEDPVASDEAPATAPEQDEPAEKPTRARRASTRTVSDEPSGDDAATAAGKRPTRSRRARKPRTEDPSTESDAPVEDDAQRHSSALDAVAELAASRGHADGAEAHEVPTTLAELEAHLPSRE